MVMLPPVMNRLKVTPTPEVSAEPVDDDELGEGSSDGDEPVEDSDDIKDD